MVELLLRHGATINAFDKKDRRAIHWAAYMGRTDVVRALVAHKAELNVRDKEVSIMFFVMQCCLMKSLYQI